MASFRNSLNVVRSVRAASPRFSQMLSRPAVRAYSTGGQAPNDTKQGGFNGVVPVVTLAAVAGVVYYYRDDLLALTSQGKAYQPKQEDYQKVYNAIASTFDDENYDDGSWAPVVLRMCWHNCGTYDKESNTGGINGATMRFAQEASDPENAGLDNGRNRVAPVKKQFPWISYADLWAIAGIAAIQEMGGPSIPFRPGRIDLTEKDQPPNGRLPDATKSHDHLRDVFYRMGFNDQEIVALTGAHAVGRCHKKNSNFDGPWTFMPISFTNEFYTLLLEETWTPRKWDGKPQFEDKGTHSLMMLPTDMSLREDSSFKKWVKAYAADQDKFFDHFSKAFARLIEPGVPEEQFNETAKRTGIDKPFIFKSTADQEN